MVCEVRTLGLDFGGQSRAVRAHFVSQKSYPQIVRRGTVNRVNSAKLCSCRAETSLMSSVTARSLWPKPAPRGCRDGCMRGTRFRAITRGVYATATVPESYATFVRATLLTLPMATIATGVTGLRLYGVGRARLSAVSLTRSDPRGTRGPSPPSIRHGATFMNDWMAGSGRLGLI